MFDFSELDLDALSDGGADLEITDPRTGEKTGAVLRVLGPDSTVARKQSFDIGNTPRLPDAAALDGRMAKMAAALVVGWRGVQWMGAEVEYTPEAVLTIMQKSRFAREQVINFSSARSNFLGKSSETSPRPSAG